PTCRQAGIVGAVAGVIGSLQALEAIKYIVGAGQLLTGLLLTCDVLTMEFRRLRVSRRDDCAVCGRNPSIMKPFDCEATVCEVPL
ncbi:MAG: hypothetical protein LBQ90_08035, partial [Synergistaceae bacterium]|nr:hypothetical protein [Synergistaceae bacterium]